MASWANFSSKNLYHNATAHSTHKYDDVSQVSICFCAIHNVELCYLDGELSHWPLSHKTVRRRNAIVTKLVAGNKMKTKTIQMDWVFQLIHKLIKLSHPIGHQTRSFPYYSTVLCVLFAHESENDIFLSRSKPSDLKYLAVGWLNNQYGNSDVSKAQNFEIKSCPLFSHHYFELKTNK